MGKVRAQGQADNGDELLDGGTLNLVSYKVLECDIS